MQSVLGLKSGHPTYWTVAGPRCRWWTSCPTLYLPDMPTTLKQIPNYMLEALICSCFTDLFQAGSLVQHIPLQWTLSGLWSRWPLMLCAARSSLLSICT